MNQVLRTYKVKERDNIKDVAKKHGLDVGELIAYHNKRTEPFEHIKNRIPMFLREIILPPEGFIIKDGKEIWASDTTEEPSVLNEPFIGMLKPLPIEKKLSYGVLKTIKNGDKENTIKYETDLLFYPENEFGERYVSLDIVSKTFINDQEPSLIIDELAVLCNEVLYPIVLQIDKNVIPLDINNHEEILKKWKNYKETKLKNYQGETAESYIALFEQKISDKDLCLHFLKNDWFFQLYFNKIYTVYLENHKQEKETITFPIIPHTKNVAFDVKKRARRFLKNNKLKIEIKGACSDKRTKTELESKLFFPAFKTNKNTVSGNYRAIYHLNPNNRIQNAFLESNLELSKNKHISISISEIENSKLPIKENEKEVEEDNKGKKIPLWKKLFSKNR